MSVRRTFSLDPEVDRFLNQHQNRSQAVNAIIKRYMKEIEQQKLIAGYQAMHSDEALKDLQDWEEATLMDRLE